MAVAKSAWAKALRDGYRKKVFLMTKIDGRTKEGRRRATRPVPQALCRRTSSTCCSTTRSSAWRIPTVSSQRVGLKKRCLQAKKAGKIRFIGFTGHKDPLVHLRMLEVAEKHKFPLRLGADPLNVMDAHFRSFDETGSSSAGQARHRLARV